MKRFRINSFDAMRAVYSFVFPETWSVLRGLEGVMSAELLRTRTRASRAQRLLRQHFPGFDLPATAGGYTDLDAIHEPIIARIIAAYANQVVGLEQFGYAYPSGGSSEVIFHLLTNLHIGGTLTINTLKGEYEGYADQALNLGMSCATWDIDDPAIDEMPEGSVWFISNPSARDGNILPDAFIERLCRLNHRIVLDLAYVGSTLQHRFDLSHEQIIAAVMSFSKPYGTFRLRIGGFLFSRQNIPTLFGSKWFKDVERLLQALALAEQIGPGGLYPRYRPAQEKIVAALNRKFGLGLIASDCLLLATLPPGHDATLSDEQRAMIAPFRRDKTYRFSLTPYFEQAFPLEDDV